MGKPQLAATLDETDAATIIQQVTKMQHALGRVGYLLEEVRVPQKGYDALRERGEGHGAPAKPPGPLGPVPKWVACLSGIPIRPIEDDQAAQRQKV